jgi:hypothetical protein
MKLTAQEWTDFWKDLGDDFYIDESTFPDFEESNMPASFEGDAYLAYQGKFSEEPIPSFLKKSELEDGQTFSVVFRRWKRGRNSTSISFTVPNEKLPEVLAALDALGINYTKS